MTQDSCSAYHDVTITCVFVFVCCCSFVPRHNSTTPAELQEMVAETGFNSMDDLIKATVPSAIM